MGFELEQDDNYAQRRLERLQLRYRRAQLALASTQVQYHLLRKNPAVSQSELTHSVNQLRRAREHLEDILSTIEFLEDQSYSALVVRRLEDTPNVSST